MPDIDFQRIVLNLIPKKGDEPVVFYASQYETARPFIADLMWGDTEFAPGGDCWAEINIRKVDNNLVVITDDVTIDNNEVSVILPQQAVTCVGKNFGQVKIYAADEQLVAALNFILEVQPDPLAGGVDSETAIDNIESQIAAIVPEVIGDDYYNKTETDALLANKADVSDLPDMDDYYTKTATDALLSDKADVSDLPDMTDYYTKTATDTLLADKVNDYQINDAVVVGSVVGAMILPGWDSEHGSYKLVKNVALDTYSKSEIDSLIDNIFPTLTASGAIASFKTALNKPLVSVTADPLATTITRCGGNLARPDYSGGASATSSGVTFTNTNGVVNVSAETATGDAYYNFYANSDGDRLVIKAGTYTVSCAETTTACTISFRVIGVDLYVLNNNTHSVTFTATTDTEMFAYIRVASGASNINLDMHFQMNSGSSALPYEAYTAETVPVADATDITTLSGVNNVFADSGDVTVQYKYMSM